MNLPNALTAARIAVTPLIACAAVRRLVALRLAAFVLFIVAAITDYVDGMLARSRKQETDLGRLLDPLADKLLLVGTFVPMYSCARARRCPVRRRPFGTPSGLARVVDRRDRARPRSCS